MASSRFTARLRQTLALAVLAGCAFGAQAKIDQVRFAVDPTYPLLNPKPHKASWLVLISTLAMRCASR